MDKLDFLGKGVVINKEGRKVLVLGDIHLSLKGNHEASEIIREQIYNKTILDLNEIRNKIDKIDKIILLGDIKSSFSELNQEERNNLINLFDYLLNITRDIVIVKGNHDNFLLNITKNKGISLLDYCIFDEYCFLHGDRDFVEIYNKNIKFWIMGHIHPSIKFKEGNKYEKYKCYLIGNYKDKKIIVLPSFIESENGIDVRDIKNIIWDFKIEEFEIKVVGENLEIYDFGKLKNIK